MVRGENSDDAIIVQTDESNRAEYYSHVPYAKALLQELQKTPVEKHQYVTAQFQCKESTLNQKPAKIEKILGLSKKDYDYFVNHLLDDYSFLHENNELMYADENDVEHCLLVIGEEHEDGVMVQTEGYHYARYSALLPNAKQFIKQNGLRSMIEDIWDIHKVKESQIRVLIVEPNQKPRIEMIDNTLEAKQQIVEGNIEVIGLSETADLICNDEGKFNGSCPNRRLGNDVIMGTFLIAGTDGSEDFCSLTPEDIEKYKAQFEKIEELSMEDVPEPRFKIIGFD